MARPARRAAQPDEPPTSDPASIDDAYRYHRLRRHARAERQREDRRARARFWFTSLLLVLLTLVIAVTIWGQVERLFGL